MKLKEKSYLFGTNLLVSFENMIPRKNLKIKDLSTRIHDQRTKKAFVQTEYANWQRLQM